MYRNLGFFTFSLFQGYDDQIALNRETKRRLIFNNVKNQKSQTLLGSEIAPNEFDPIAKIHGNITIHPPYQYTITLDIDLEETFIDRYKYIVIKTFVHPFKSIFL